MAEREVEEAALRYLVEGKGIPWVLAREILLEATMGRKDADAYVLELAQRGGYVAEE
jgi:hypothetical protein